MAYFPSYYTAVKSIAPDRHGEHRDKRQPLMLNTGQPIPSIPTEQVSDDPRRRSRRGLPLPCQVAYFSGYKYTPLEDGEGFSRRSAPTAFATVANPSFRNHAASSLLIRPTSPGPWNTSAE